MRSLLLLVFLGLVSQTAGQFNFGNFGNLLANFGGQQAAATAAPNNNGAVGGGFGNLLGNLFGGVQNIGNAVMGVANGVNQIKGGVMAVQNIAKNPTGGATGINGLNNVLGNLGMLGNIAGMFQGGLMNIGMIGNIFGGANGGTNPLGNLIGGAVTGGMMMPPAMGPSSPASPMAPAAPMAAAGGLIGGMIGNIPNIFQMFLGNNNGGAAMMPANAANPAGGLFGGLIGQGGLFGGLLNANIPGLNQNPMMPAMGAMPPAMGPMGMGPMGPMGPMGMGPMAPVPMGPANQQMGLFGNWFNAFPFGGAFGRQQPNVLGQPQQMPNNTGMAPGPWAPGPFPGPFAPGPGMMKVATTKVGVGQPCRGVSGTCRDSTSFQCGLPYKSNLCPGPAAVKCCPASSTSGVTQNQNVNVPALPMPAGRRCALVTPTGCSSFQGKRVVVNNDFADEVIRINAHARNAGIRLYITDSFRPSSAGYGAARSRHKAGFALDLNANGCNAACLCAGRSISNTGARNFVTAVMADSTLHWGGDPARPIAWSVGGCSRDSVHFQSSNYPLQSTSAYDAAVPCLNTAFRNNQFTSFSCGSGAGLLNEDVKMSEQIEEAAAKDLSPGAIAAIVIFSVLVLVACVAVAACLIQRRRRLASEDIVMPNAMFTNDASNMASAVYERNDNGGTIGGRGNTVSAGSTPGNFACKSCGKTYNYEADLAEHTALRHP